MVTFLEDVVGGSSWYAHAHSRRSLGKVGLEIADD